MKNVTSYEDFSKKNYRKINGYINICLWIGISIGPLMAIPIALGIIHSIDYFDCLFLSGIILLLAAIHRFAMYKFPDSKNTAIFALVSLDILLFFLNYSHFAIKITWFLVPLLSILYVNKTIYMFSSLFNYMMMTLAAYETAPFYAARKAGNISPKMEFRGSMTGYTIEAILMFIVGYVILEVSINYMKQLMEKFLEIRDHEKDMQEQMKTLRSMAEIYNNVNLINFINSTEISLRDENKVEHKIEMPHQNHTRMTQSIRKFVVPEQLDDFWKFTDITTVRARLTNKKILSSDFINATYGWFRAQYIAVDETADGIPNIVIFTTRNIDEEKRREEHLINISLTDELTRLFNRRCYDDDVEVYKKEGLPEDFVIFSVDVNGLKKANDTIGHAAGDELIKGAADCLQSTIGSFGKTYRTGGDEFLAILHTNNPGQIVNDIKAKAAQWRGLLVDKLSLSVGYAAYVDSQDASIEDLEHKADKHMYEDKNRYYKENGIDRRK